MSVTVAKADGITILTLTSDPNSACPPLCQILKGFCYSPACCSLSQPLRRLQGTSQSVLGALQIMVGVLHIGLGSIVFSSGASSFEMDVTGYPFWLGALFILFGITCILSEKFPSPCLVITNVILNLAGVAFAIASIVLYSCDTAGRWFAFWSMCRHDDDYYWDYETRRTTTVTPEEQIIIEKCLRGKEVLLMMVRSINIVLIVLSVLELCIVISVVVLGIKALKKRGKGETKETENPELYKPLLEDVPSNPAV